MLHRFKASPAHAADEGSFLRMDDAMIFQLVLIDEPFAASGANVTSLPHVTFYVYHQMVTIRKSFVAQLALVPLDTQMVLHVLRQRRTLSEGFAAKVAHQGFLPGVDTPVLLHVPSVRKAPSADIAGMLLDALVDESSMHPQESLGPELFAAQLARKRLLPGVHPHMLLQFIPFVPAREGALIALQVLTPVQDENVFRQVLVLGHLVDSEHALAGKCFSALVAVVTSGRVQVQVSGERMPFQKYLTTDVANVVISVQIGIGVILNDGHFLTGAEADLRAGRPTAIGPFSCSGNGTNISTNQLHMAVGEMLLQYRSDGKRFETVSAPVLPKNTGVFRH